MNEYLIKTLKEGRIKKGLKQSQVAEMVGVKPNTLSNYENGVSEPDIDTFASLCDIYDLDFSYVLGEAYGLGVQGGDFSIKPSEIDIIKKYRNLDTHGKKMVDFTLQEEWDRCTSTSGEVQMILNEKIEDPIFLPKDFFNYNIMKEKAKELKTLKKNVFIDYMDMVKFLWRIGYNKKICIADLVGVMSGLIIPSSQLYKHISYYLTNNYEISFPETNDELLLNAAHERTDVEVTEEMKQHDDAFFDEED